MTTPAFHDIAAISTVTAITPAAMKPSVRRDGEAASPGDTTAVSERSSSDELGRLLKAIVWIPREASPNDGLECVDRWVGAAR